MNYLKLLALGVIVLIAAMAPNWAVDLAYQVHAVLIMLIAAWVFIHVLREIGPFNIRKSTHSGYI